MLYDIIPDTPRLNYDPRQNLEPHAVGIIGSKNSNSKDQVRNQMQNLSLNQSAVGQATTSFSPTQSLDVHSV